MSHRHQWEKALGFLQQTQDIQNASIYQKLQQSTESLAAEYLMGESARQHNRLLEQRNHILFLTFILSLLLLIFLFMLYQSYQQRKKNREEMAVAKEEISDLIDKNRSIADNYQEFIRKDHLVIDTIIQKYNQEPDEKNRKYAVYQWVEDYILALRNDKKTLKGIEKTVNADGTMDMLDTCLPHLPVLDRKILCLMLAGFSYGAIHAITETGIQTLYNRKRKYKNILESLRTEVSKALLDRF